VWLGVSVEDQAAADDRIPELLDTPAAVRFLSCEPLLEAVDLTAFMGGPYVGLPGDVVHPNYNAGLHWVIVGGESGAKAMPCRVEWIRSAVLQCRAAGVPVFVKQLGASVEMAFEEWNRITDGGASGSDKFILLFEGADVGYWRLNDRKGGDPAEWPEDLRVREMPLAPTGGEAA
jgi:protein gp37